MSVRVLPSVKTLGRGPSMLLPEKDQPSRPNRQVARRTEIPGIGAQPNQWIVNVTKRQLEIWPKTLQLENSPACRISRGLESSS